MRKEKTSRFIAGLFKDQVTFFTLYFNCLKKIDKPGVRVLHIGCGWDKRKIRDQFQYIDLFSMDIGLNTLIKNKNSLRVCGDAYSLPFRLQSFDYIICEDFVEHIEFPDLLLLQLNLILKKKGEFIFVTPGGWSYIAILSKLTPLKFHKWYNNRLRGVEINDIYPAYYSFNSKYSIAKRSKENKFIIKDIRFVTGYPSYFRFSTILTHVFGIVHILISRVKFLNNIFGVNIFCVIKKT